MKYRREIDAPPEEVIRGIKSRCNCNLSLFRMREMSFLLPKDYGVFCVSHKDCLYFSINEKKTFGFNAPKRHLRIKLSGDSTTTLVGRFCFSDFAFYLIVGIAFSIIAGIGTRFYQPKYLFLFVISYMGIWVFYCLIGMIAFRKEETALLDRVDDLLTSIELRYNRL